MVICLWLILITVCAQKKPVRRTGRRHLQTRVQNHVPLRMLIPCSVAVTVAFIDFGHPASLVLMTITICIPVVWLGLKSPLLGPSTADHYFSLDFVRLKGGHRVQRQQNFRYNSGKGAHYLTAVFNSRGCQVWSFCSLLASNSEITSREESNMGRQTQEMRRKWLGPAPDQAMPERVFWNI